MVQAPTAPPFLPTTTACPALPASSARGCRRTKRHAPLRRAIIAPRAAVALKGFRVSLVRPHSSSGASLLTLVSKKACLNRRCRRGHHGRRTSHSNGAGTRRERVGIAARGIEAPSQGGLVSGHALVRSHGLGRRGQGRRRSCEGNMPQHMHILRRGSSPGRSVRLHRLRFRQLVRAQLNKLLPRCAGRAHSCRRRALDPRRLVLPFFLAPPEKSGRPDWRRLL